MARILVEGMGAFRGTSLGAPCEVTWELFSQGLWQVIEEGEGWRETTRGTGGMDRLSLYLDSLFPELGQVPEQEPESELE